MENPNPAIDALLGLAVADAVGVPYEFLSREEILANPARDMIGFGTHNQPPGTWSDDSSLAFCLAESLTQGYSLVDMAQKFVDWRERNYWTAHDELFDIGNTTAVTLRELSQMLAQGTSDAELTLLRWQATEMDNGNGSLMRILPLLFHLQGMPLEEQFAKVWEVSALTHKHIRAAMCCQIYLRIAEHLLSGLDRVAAYPRMRQEIEALWEEIDFPLLEQAHFSRVIQRDVRELQENDLRSGGYVIETLEASLWAFLTQDTYEQMVLTSINLGEDTDTTAAVTGGLAGMYFGYKGIPRTWLAQTARMRDIWDLGTRLWEAKG